MNYKKFLIAFLAAGVVMNIIDFLVHGLILQSTYQAYPSLFNPMGTFNIGWFIFGDFVAAAVFVWVYNRVFDSFGGGIRGGLMYGLYAGILICFPAFLFFHLIFVSFPYSLSWIWTIYGIVAYAILGIVVGVLYRKQEAAA
jgi:hypothetical protein